MQIPSPAPTRLRRRLARLGGVCLAAALVWACGPVYIPVPPPERAAFTAEMLTDSAGTQRTFWTTVGPPEPNAVDARFVVIDAAREAGVVTTAEPDGSYAAPPMEGAEGDQIFIYYEDPVGHRSPTACLILSERRPWAAPCR